MLKNKCSVWKRIKFPTFWYNCYYFTWSDTYFMQLETLLISHPSYVWNLEYVYISFHVSCSLILYPSTEVTERSSLHLPPAVMLPLPTYFPVFPSSCVISPFTWMLVVTAIACDKRCELVDIGLGGLEVNMTECREWEVWSYVITAIHGTSFHDLSMRN